MSTTEKEPGAVVWLCMCHPREYTTGILFVNAQSLPVQVSLVAMHEMYQEYNMKIEESFD